MPKQPDDSTNNVSIFVSQRGIEQETWNSQKRNRLRLATALLTCELVNAVVMIYSNRHEPRTAGPVPKELIQCEGN